MVTGPIHTARLMHAQCLPAVYCERVDSGEISQEFEGSLLTEIVCSQTNFDSSDDDVDGGKNENKNENETKDSNGHEAEEVESERRKDQDDLEILPESGDWKSDLRGLRRS
eukprot:3283889-Pleurochrysis_carterae.AAC.1